MHLFRTLLFPSVLCLLALPFGFLGDAAQAATLTVSSLADNGSAGTLRAEIARAASGDTIAFGSGLSGTLTLNGTELTIQKNLTIQGPGSGGIRLHGAGKSRVFSCLPPDLSSSIAVSISGVTIVGGSSAFGGGIMNGRGSTLVLNDSLVSGNSASTTASNFGGGIYNDGALTLNRATVSDNSVRAAEFGDGGGIYNLSALLLNQSTVSNNSVTNGKGGGGGGIASFNRARIIKSTLNNNRVFSSSYALGGAVYQNALSADSLFVSDSTLSGNTVSSDSTSNNGYGGAICSFGSGTWTVSNSTIAGNSVSTAITGLGGGLYNDSKLILQNSTVFGNSVLGVGGGVFSNGNLTIQSSTISSNSASPTGGSPGAGGGVLLNGDASRPTLLSHSIVASNRSANGPDIIGSIEGGDYNLVQNPGNTVLPGTHNLFGMDPLLGGLNSNGGPTQTMAPYAGSPAIDAGDPNFDAFNVPFDQRGEGFARVANGRIDIGAVEGSVSLPTLSVGDISVSEGFGNDTNAIFTVTLSASSTQTISVRYATADDSAIAGSDYLATGGTLTFSPGETTQTLSVPVLTDALAEGDEIFFVNLSESSGATLADAQGVGTISAASDDSAPSVSIATPAHRSFITSFASVSGAATDNIGGSGITRVDLFFKRQSDGKYWNGTAWEDTLPVALVTALQGANWSKTAGLPSTSTSDPSQKLLEGAYLVTATAYDGAGNSKSTSHLFTLDRTNPLVSITTPANQSFVTSLLTISGTAMDNPGGSGIARVEVFLRRNADGKYWTGSLWGDTRPVVLPAGLNKGAWGLTSSLLPSPTASDPAKRLFDGAYSIFATAFDRAGNRKSISNLFTLDRVNPVVGISSPAHRSFIVSLPSITGTALDNAGGSGIARVDLLLKRNSDGRYWNGTAWGNATPVALAVGFNKGAWGRAGAGLPSPNASDIAKRLTPGDYIATATAFDRAGNRKSASHFFTVTAPAPGPASSPLM